MTTPPDDRLCLAAHDLLDVCIDLAESAEYWSEYDVPLGIVDRLNAAIAKAGGTALRTPDHCHWRPDADGNWDSGCGRLFCLETGDPSENGMDFCPFCARPIRQENPHA